MGDMFNCFHRLLVLKPLQTSKIPILDNSYMGIEEFFYILTSTRICCSTIPIFIPAMEAVILCMEAHNRRAHCVRTVFVCSDAGWSALGSRVHSIFSVVAPVPDVRSTFA